MKNEWPILNDRNQNSNPNRIVFGNSIYLLSEMTEAEFDTALMASARVSYLGTVFRTDTDGECQDFLKYLKANLPSEMARKLL